MSCCRLSTQRKPLRRPVTPLSHGSSSSETTETTSRPCRSCTTSHTVQRISTSRRSRNSLRPSTVRPTTGRQTDCGMPTERCKRQVRGTGQRLLTDLVSLVRHALDPDGELVPFPEIVAERYSAWLEEQAAVGRMFTDEQRVWLDRIRDHIAASLRITPEDFDYAPFNQHGGLGAAYEALGDDLTLFWTNSMRCSSRERSPAGLDKCIACGPGRRRWSIH